MDKDQQQDLNPGEQLDQPVAMRKTIIKEQQEQGKVAGVDQGRRFQRPQGFRGKGKRDPGDHEQGPQSQEDPGGNYPEGLNPFPLEQGIKRRGDKGEKDQ